MPVKDPRKTTTIILEALKRTGQRGILHAGWGGIGGRELPGDIFKIDYADYRWLFPRMAMVIHTRRIGHNRVRASLRRAVVRGLVCVRPILLG